MCHLLKLLRLKQWIKNLLIFAAPFFGGKLSDGSIILPIIITFFAFCVAASSIYCLNDVIDAATDRLHPRKALRPVAAGKVGRGAALLLSLILGSGGVALAWWGVSMQVALVIAAYILLNVAYSLLLKQFTLIDVITIAIGFVLRLLAGGLSSDVALSSWIVIMVFLLALFLAVAKRRDEFVAYTSETEQNMRKSVRRYTKEYLNLILAMLSAVILVAYIIYTTLPSTVATFGTNHLYLTSIFVLCGIFRYLEIAVVDQKSGSPTNIIYTDRVIISMILCWLISFLIIIYIAR